MTQMVNAWHPEGKVYIWRYARPSARQGTWHLSGDHAGCSSIVDLIDRMTASGEPCHRTMGLGVLTPKIWDVPNFGRPEADRFEKLLIEFEPAITDLRLVATEDRLHLTFGKARSAHLRAALVDVSFGIGDFGVATSDSKRADYWMFWWLVQ